MERGGEVSVCVDVGSKDISARFGRWVGAENLV